MSELIQTQMFMPRCFKRASIAFGSGNFASSHSKSHQWCSFIHKQSK